MNPDLAILVLLLAEAAVERFLAEDVDDKDEDTEALE